MFQAMRGYAENNGDWITYYRYDAAATQTGPGVRRGDQRRPPVPPGCPGAVPARQPHRGRHENSDKGFYYNDELDAQIAFDLFLQAGMTMADIETGNYVKDRVLYDRKLFRVTQLSVEGQIQQRDIIVGLSASQLKPDELVNDTQFAEWSLWRAKRRARD